MDWTAGYVTEIEYTYGYYRELCPALLRLACLSAGVTPPAARELRYLELGYGQGLSINIHAAAVLGEFWGTDFNPTQAAHARALAEASGVRATLLDSSFADLGARPDLPEFDVIALHGIWTWISDENSRIVVDIIRRKLRIGGIVYISYNCLPGWSPAVPLRHLMMLHSELAGSEAGGLINKINEALGFAQKVIESGAFYFRGNPAVSERLKTLLNANRNYLAHEYFNEDWRIMAFSEVAKQLNEAKLTFVASAHLMDHVDAINLSPEGQKLLAEIKNPILKQSVRDYFVNQQFRRDVFVKGPRRLTLPEQYEALRSDAFVLVSHPDDIPMKAKGALGEATLQENMYRPLIEAIAENNFAPKKIEQLVAHHKLKGMQLANVLQAILVLTGEGYIHPAQQGASISRKYTQALNRHLLQRARSRADVNYLASPITGGGVAVPRFHQLFLLGLQQGGKSEDDLASLGWNLSLGQRVIKDGKPLESAEENVAELKKMAQHFLSKRLPILKVLEVC